MASSPIEYTGTQHTGPWGPATGTTPRNEFAEARAAERERSELQNDRATRVVAGNAIDAQDCRSLLLMLGLTGSVDGSGETTGSSRAPGRL
jgi:hypothetical protein